MDKCNERLTWCSLNSSFLAASTGSKCAHFGAGQTQQTREKRSKRKKKVVRKMWNIAHIRLDTKCTLIYYI